MEAPQIPVSLLLFALFLAVTWVILLRFFAVPIVFATELVKLCGFVYLAVQAFIEGLVPAGIVSLVCAVVLVAWDIYAFKKLKFAGAMLEQAANSFKANARMFLAFFPIFGLYAANAGIFVFFFARSFDVVEVEETLDGSCYFVSPSYTTPVVVYLSAVYLWSILLFKNLRLSIIATIVGSWKLHPDRKPSIGRAVINTCTTSLGTLSVASLVTALAERFNRWFLRENLLMNCLNPIFWIIMPLYCLFGNSLRMLVQMLTKFSVILHVFTGMSWLGSAKKVFKILKRHFKGGFVTEYASGSVLALGSYVFSIGIYFIAWIWLDKEFQTNTFIGFNDSAITAAGWLLFALFNIWYPVLGLYLLILLNRWLRGLEDASPETWITPIAAAFIGCLAMMFFSYLASTFLDAVDVLFLCFAIERDNNAVAPDDDFAKLVYEGVPTVLKEPDLEGTCSQDSDEEAPAVAVAAVVTPRE